MNEFIILKGARENNLKDFDLIITHKIDLLL